MDQTFCQMPVHKLPFESEGNSTDTILSSLTSHLVFLVTICPKDRPGKERQPVSTGESPFCLNLTEVGTEWTASTSSSTCSNWLS